MDRMLSMAASGPPVPPAFALAAMAGGAYLARRGWEGRKGSPAAPAPMPSPRSCSGRTPGRAAGAARANGFFWIE